MKNKIIKILRGTIVISSFTFFGLASLFFRYITLPIKKSIWDLTKQDYSEKNLKIRYSEVLQKSWQYFLNFLIWIKILKLNIDNLERLKNIKNSIIISTHPSFIDILILISIIPHSTCFVAERLANNIFLKGIVNLLFIIEGQSQEGWLKDSKTMIEDGFNLIIFPMGIRHKKNERPKIRRGTALLAQKTKKDIIMINMSTSYDFLQIHQPISDAGIEPVVYNIEYKGIIATKEFIEKYTDEVTCRTELSKYITKNLY